ncbi:MAG: hypothetical protein HQ488_02125 [Parcubacteria group bacterium]|nr:hypothetical protein [Parcubacteria group bacterium]
MTSLKEALALLPHHLKPTVHNGREGGEEFHLLIGTSGHVALLIAETGSRSHGKARILFRGHMNAPFPIWSIDGLQSQSTHTSLITSRAGINGIKTIFADCPDNFCSFSDVKIVPLSRLTQGLAEAEFPTLQIEHAE